MNPLFRGTVHFVKMIFNVAAENTSHSVNDQDMNTIVNYATAAAVPISLYADQYGESAIVVSPNVIPYSVNLTSHSCSRSQMEAWIQDLTKQVLKPACFVVMFPPPIDNGSESRASGTGGFHDSINGTPYVNAYINSAPNVDQLTLQDSPFLYAGHLSHELAEMTVNPTGGNPEVCDPCGPNYNSTYLSYFDAAGSYITTTQTPPYQVDFAYNFYINGIVEPAYAKPATAPATACAYSPVKVSEASLPQTPGSIRCDGFYSADDQNRHAITGAKSGAITEIYFSPQHGQSATGLGQINGLVDLCGFYTPDDKTRHVLALSVNGDITELFYGPVKGQSVVGNISGAKRVTGFYSDDDGYRHGIVACSDGSIWEIYFHPTKGRGQDQIAKLPNIVDVGSFYSGDDHYRHVIAATADGDLTEIYYQPKYGVSKTAVADLPGITSVTAFYVPGALYSRRIQAIDQQGGLYEFRFAPTYGVSKAKLQTNPGATDVGGFYSPDDKARHAIVLSNDSKLREDYYYF